MTIDTDRAPSDEELDDWIDAQGCSNPRFIAECEERMPQLIEEGELRREPTTFVPYGSTSVALPESVEVPEKVLRSVAFEWWESELIGFEIGPIDPYSTLKPYRYLLHTDGSED